MIVFVHVREDPFDRDSAREGRVGLDRASSLVGEAILKCPERDRGAPRSWHMSATEPEEFDTWPWARVEYVRAAHIGPPDALVVDGRWFVTRPSIPSTSSREVAAAVREVTADTYWHEVYKLDADSWLVAIVMSP